MAVPFSNTKLRVPKGFQNILECLAREVLRSQPDNIHEFAAAYFESLLRIREETGHDPAVHGARLEDRNYNSDSYKKLPVDPNEVQQKTAGATVIQTQFRQQVAKEEVHELREEDAAIKIQAGYRGFMGREEVRKIKEDQPTNTQDEEIDIDLSCPEVEKAALKIQAGFKGFKARKEAQSATDDEDTTKEIDVDTAQNLEDRDSAATTIQAGFRGHTTGQELQEQNVLPSNNLDNQLDDELQDIDLTDPDLSKAALKIQAGFRGLKSRKDIQDKKEKQKLEAETEEDTKQKLEVETTEEEIIDIDLEDPDVQKSALLIQAGFKGLKARKHLRQKAEEKQQEESQQEEIAEEEEKVIPQKSDEIELDADNAAVKIQAAYRGHVIRKSLNEASDSQTLKTADLIETEETKSEKVEEEEEVDIDLTDPAVQAATLKLQAGFKGFKARKEMQGKVQEVKTEDEESKSDNVNENKTEDGVVDENEGVGASEGLDTEGNVTGQDDFDKEKAVTKIQAGFRGMKAREQVKAIQESRKEVDKSEEEAAEEEPEEM